MPPSHSKKRPPRAAAGRVSIPAGFVKTDDAVARAGDSSDSELDLPGRRARLAKGKKYFQHSIPDPGPLEPIHYLEDDDDDYASSLEDLSCGNEIKRESDANEPGSSSSVTLPNTVSLTFNVPQGHTGPFVVNLSLKDLVDAPQKKPPVSPPSLPSSLRLPKKSQSEKSASLRESRLSFNDLPLEIKSMIYHLLFVSTSKLQFRLANFTLSSQFLRTCSQVHKEGGPILYGKNAFVLHRDPNVAGPLWKKPWYEVGWRNIRTWFTNLGSTNISLLRDVTLELEDGSPSQNPSFCRSLHSQSQREAVRYVYDGHLLVCLTLLARYSQLQDLTLEFNGRKNLSRRDDRFLNALKKISADQVHLQRQYSYSWHRIEPEVQNYLQRRMVRKVKQYTNKAKTEV